MKRLVLTAMAILLASPGAVRAGLGDSLLYWATTGVMNTGNLATVFQCSNPDTAASQGMDFEIFKADGTLAGTGSVSVPPGGTRTVSTQTLYSLAAGDYTNIGITFTVLGSARVGSKDLICAAWVMSNGTSPGYMNSLPIIKKAKQRGQ